MDINYEYKPAFTLMTVSFNAGEQLKVEPGAMVAQSSGLNMKTGMSGSLIGGFMKKAFGGESFFVNTYTATKDGDWISLAPSSPGDIDTFNLQANGSLFIQPGSYLASTNNVVTTTKFQGAKSLLSKEGAFFIKATAEGSEGVVYYNAYGAIKSIEISPENPVIVDNGHVVAFTEGLSYNVTKVGGLGSAILGGEGVVLNFSGKGTVFIQTRNLTSLAGSLMPFMRT